MTKYLAEGEPVEVVDMNCAIDWGYPAIYKLLWEKEPLPEFTEMTYAVSQGAPISELEKLLARGVPVERPWDSVTTHSGVAARFGNIEAARWLIAHGANVRATINPWMKRLAEPARR